MLNQKPHRIIACFIVMFGLLIAQDLQASKIYLDPDTLLLTGAIGTEFEIELKIDDIQDVKFFKAYYNFNPEVLDTVSFTQGPLFPSSGAGTWPGADLFGNDTVMALEDMIYGAGVSVDGPGTLFTIRLKALAPGVANLYPIDHVIRDVVGDTILGTEQFGTIILVDYPPVPFELLEPYEGEPIAKYPRDSIEFVWNSMWSLYPGEGVDCQLEYGTSETFDSEQTVVVSGLSNVDTTHTIYTSDMETNGTIYWRVIATGDIHGYERISLGTFELNVMDPIAEFDTNLPLGGLLLRYPMDSIKLVWDASGSVYPGDNVSYTIEYGTSALFESGSTITISDFVDTAMYLYVDDLEDDNYFWRVTAISDLYGYERLCTSASKSFEFHLMTPFSPCALQTPTQGESVTGPPFGYVNFGWTSSISVYPGETVSYRIELSKNPNFVELAVPVATISDTTYSVLIGDLTDGDYFWRVTVIGDIYGFEASSTPFSNYFSLLIGGALPADFNLVSPMDESVTNIAYMTETALDWEDANSGDPYDTIQYTFFLGPDTNFLSTAIMIDTIQDELSILIPTASLPLGESLFWRVLAKNRFDLERWSTESYRIVFYLIGDITLDRIVDLADITRLIDIVYISKIPAYPSETADVTCDDLTDLADITRLIDNVYISKQDLICP